MQPHDISYEEEVTQNALEIICRYAKKYNWQPNKVVYILAQWVGDCAAYNSDVDFYNFDLYLRRWDDYHSFDRLGEEIKGMLDEIFR